MDEPLEGERPAEPSPQAASRTGSVAARPWLASYPEGVPESLAPYPRLDLFRMLAEAVRDHPNAPAVSFFGKRMTYRQLGAEVERFSGILHRLGVSKGDRVALVLPNSPQYLVAAFGALRLGAVVVGNNPLYTERELEHQLADCGAEVCVTLDSLYPKVAAVRARTSVREVVATRITDYMPFPIAQLAPLKLRREAKEAGEPWPPVPAGAPVRWWSRLMASAPPAPPPADIDPDQDLAGLVYTGGTTGFSKGAMLTHANVVANAMQCRAWLPDLKPGGEAMMCVLPFFHSYGLAVGLLLGVRIAAKLILVPRFELTQTLKAIQKERATLFPGVPRLYIAINEAPETGRYDLTSVRACLSGAAALPQAVAERFGQITGATLVEGYGLTECSPVTHANPLDGRARPGSIGLPLPDTVCRIVDLDDWTVDVADGESGELAISGPQVMRGYWNRPEETDAMIKTAPDGGRWLLTGDVASMAPDGFFHIVDRKKDMIIVSGFNVYPTEIEDVLYRHPKVLKACVAGVPDARTGEAVKAYIVLHQGTTATAEEIVEFCRNPRFGLTGYRVPKLVEFRDSLPETLIGKVLRRVLAEEERARLEGRGGGTSTGT